jgi:hypothetical protein
MSKQKRSEIAAQKAFEKKQRAANDESASLTPAFDRLSRWLKEYGTEVYNDEDGFTLCWIRSGEMVEITPAELARHVTENTCPTLGNNECEADDGE